MKLNSIIVEDEETSREILKNYLKKYCPNVSVLGEASNVNDPVMYDHLGDVYHKLKDNSSAIKYWKKSIKIKDNPVILKKINKIK